MMIKKILALSLSVLFCGFVGGCSYVTVNKDRDNAQIVADVNGTQISKEQYKDTATAVLGNFGMTLEDIDKADDPSMYKEYIINQLVDEELMYQQAVKDGLVDLSDQHLQDVIKQKSDEADSMYSYFLSQAENDGESDPKAAALTNWNEYLRQNGYDNLEALAKKQIRDSAVADVYQKVIADVAATEQDAKEYYDTQVELQKDLVKNDPSNYNIYKNANQAYVNPEGSRYVKNLLVQIPSEIQTEIKNLRSSGDDEAADKLRDEALKEIEAIAKGALERIKSGEDFDVVLEEVGEDPGMQNEPGKTFGYLVVDGGQDYVQAFQDAAMGLNSVGEMTDLVPTDYGYHIIKYIKDGAGAVDFEIVKDSIIDSQTSSKQNDAVTKFLDGLKEQAQVNTYIDKV